MILKTATWALAAALAFPALAETNAVQTVHEAVGYNSWPMIQAIGKRLVCAYSRRSAHPTAWSAHETLFEGHEERAYDAGNVNVTRLGDVHFAATYTGTTRDTAVIVVPVSRRP